MTELPDGSIDMVMTSPPYWGLRDYGDDVKEIWGGDSNCQHKFNGLLPGHHIGQVPQTKKQVASGSKDSGQFCLKCNAWHGQLGLEPTFQLYLDHMMMVCTEVKRVLKKTGSFWLNMGDTYNAGRSGGWPGGKKGISRTEITPNQSGVNVRGIQAKCLIGIPWRLVLRLIDEQGWILRNAGIWNKPNSMPSSTKDRLSNSYEFLFHLVKNTKPQYYWNEKTVLMADTKPSKAEQIEDIDWEWRDCPKCEGTGKVKEDVEALSAEGDEYIEQVKGEKCKRCKGTGKIKHSFWHSLGYWYDLDAIREQYTKPLDRWGGDKLVAKGKASWDEGTGQSTYRDRDMRPNKAGKNPGDVWTIPTQPRPEAHFATFPDKLCIKPILASCPQEICKKCGKARVRITNKEYTTSPGQPPAFTKQQGKKFQEGKEVSKRFPTRYEVVTNTIGWTDCGCNAGWDSGVLLDPFGGRGTSAVMAKKMGRHYIVYELKKEYCEELIKPALEEIDPLFDYKKPGGVAYAL